MDWVKKLNNVIDYIEKNLTNEISYDYIAKLARCSIYNFQRMFSYIADKSLAEYIRNRRLTMAAFDLLNTKERILDISLKYGYESQDSFTRAFKSFHGVLPSTVRTQTVNLKSCPKLSFQIRIEGTNEMEYRVEKLSDFTIIGVTKRVNKYNIFTEVDNIWNDCIEKGYSDKFEEISYGSHISGCVGITRGYNDDGEEMLYTLGAVNYNNIDNCDIKELDKLQYTESMWIVFQAKGQMPDVIEEFYKIFYTKWLPSSGFELGHMPNIVRYLDNDNHEIWISVNKK